MNTLTELEGPAGSRGGGTGVGGKTWAWSLTGSALCACRKQGMKVRGSEACAGIHLGSIAVLACEASRQGILSNPGMILKEPFI